MAKPSAARDAVEAELHKDARVTSWQWEHRGSGHQGCRFITTNGNAGLVVVANTTSDHRALMNMATQTRRSVREAFER